MIPPDQTVVSRLVVRPPNWLGDAVLALPAIVALRTHFASASLTVAAAPGVAALFREDTGVRPDAVIVLPARGREIARTLSQGQFELGILFPNSFASAWQFRRAAIAQRWGYATSARGWLLTRTSHPARGTAHSAPRTTIDQDLGATDYTFGFNTAVQTATDAIDRHRDTAISHDRVMVLEVMGRYAGWIAIYAGLAGGADVIPIPEIPFNYDSVCAKIAERERTGRRFSIVVVAEGTRVEGGDFVTSVEQPKHREARQSRRLRGRSPWQSIWIQIASSLCSSK